MDLKFEELKPEFVLELARETLYEYDQDWTSTKEEYLKLVCIDILDKFKSLTKIERDVALLTSTITLMVENHFLHTKIINNKH